MHILRQLSIQPATINPLIQNDIRKGQLTILNINKRNHLTKQTQATPIAKSKGSHSITQSKRKPSTN